MELLKELWLFLKVRKKFWMLPLMVMMLIVGSLLFAVKGSTMGVFIYTLF